MSHKSVLNSNRIFIDTGLSNNITTKLTLGITLTSTTITVQDTSNFKDTGVIKISTEEIYYDSKTSSTFTNLTRGFNSTTKVTANSGDTVNQTYSAVNENNTTDTKLAGWYTDVLSNQVSLRIGNSDVIQPGIIRYNEDNGVMDGCYLIDLGSNQPLWSSINNITDFSTNVKALSGVDGTTLSDNQLRAYGDIQTINVETDVTLGQVVKTKLDTSDNKLKVSPCKISISKITINQGTDNTFSVSSTPINLSTNDKIIFENGSIATLNANASSGSGSLNVNVTGNDVIVGELGYIHKLTDCGNLGIALSTATAGNKVKILTKGICAIKLTNNFTGSATIKGGIPIGINSDGYGALQSTSNVIVLGNTLHNFAYVENAYQLINFDPKIDYTK